MGRDVIIACDFNSKEEVINFLGKFKEEKPGGRSCDQHCRCHQDHLALHPVSGYVQAVRTDVIPSQESNAADDN